MSWILLTILLHAPAEAGLLEQCRAWFARAAKPEALSLEERLAWKGAFDPGGTHPDIAASRSDEHLFWHVYASLPEAVRSRLESLPHQSREHHKQIAAWYEDSHASFLRQVLRKLDRDRRPTESVVDYLRRHEAAHREALARDPALKTRLDEAFAFGRRQSRANEAWVGGAGVVPLPIVDRKGKQFLRIGKEEFEAQRKDGQWIITVPKERVAHPFWNPVSQEKLMAMTSAGVKTPRAYETTLGLDGRFYLLDGNHRFELDPRGMIRVKISDPPQTTNLRGMFDLVGIPQPSESQILDFHEGRIDWRGLLLSPEDASRFPLLHAP